MRKLHIAALVSAAAAMVAPAAATVPGITASGEGYRIGIVGYVPVICRASVDAAVIAPGAGVASLGTLNEFCNSPNGYRVVASYSPSLAAGRLVVDGTAIELGDSGAVVVSQSDAAAIAQHSVSLELPEGVTDGALNFRIEPL